MTLDHDFAPPSEIIVHASAVEGRLRHQELSYASRFGGRVTATLIAPDTGENRGPSIIYFHWGFGNRHSCVAEARCLARSGAVTLLIDAPNMGERGPGLPRVDREQVALSFLRQSVSDVRTAVDILIARGADPARIAYVGHSLGATVGGPLAGVEHRFAAIVLAGGYSQLSLGGWSFRPNAAYSQALAPYDGTRLIPECRAALLLQYALGDAFVSRATAQALIDAAPLGTQARWYHGDHRLTGDACFERAAWLCERLDLLAPAASELLRVQLPMRDIFRYQLVRPVFWLAAALSPEKRQRMEAPPRSRIPTS